MCIQMKNLMILIMNPRGGYVLGGYTCIYMYDHDYVMDFHLMVMLHSNSMGPMDDLL